MIRTSKLLLVLVCMLLTPAAGSAATVCGSGNQRPIWTLPVPPGDVTVREGEPYQVQLPSATDPEGDPITYSIINGPRFSRFNPASRLWEWTPGFSNKNGRRHPNGLSGDAVLYFAATDSCGNTSQFNVQFNIQNNVHAPLHVAPAVIAENLAFFPYIAWGIPLYAGGVNKLQEIRALGFNTVGTQALGYNIDRTYPNDSPERTAAINSAITHLRNYLDAAELLGLRVIVMAHQPAIISALKEHPAVLAWSLPDEVDFWIFPDSDRYHVDYYSPTNISAMASAIRAVDSRHPITANFTARFAEVIRPATPGREAIDGAYREYFASLDFIMFDYYLQNNVAAADQGTPQYAPIVGGMVEDARVLSDDLKAIVPLIEATNYTEQLPASQHTTPITSFDIRRQTASVISAGASGVAFYGANDYLNLTGQRVYSSWDISPELAAAFPAISARTLSSVSRISATPVDNEVTYSPVFGDPGSISPTESYWEVSWVGQNRVQKIVCGGSFPEFAEYCDGYNLRLPVLPPQSFLVRFVTLGADNAVAVHTAQLIVDAPPPPTPIPPAEGTVGSGDGNGGDDGPVSGGVGGGADDGGTDNVGGPELDSDGDGLSDEVELDQGTDPLRADTDNDGVSDSRELTDGSNPVDRGSYITVLGTEVCAEWNGFLGGMLNILEQVNLSSHRLEVVSTIFDIVGNPQESISHTIAPGAETDLLVHDLQTREVNSYGKICSRHEGEDGAVDGRMVFYKPKSSINTGADAYEFAFAMPLDAGKRGSQFVPFNTFQPSLAPGDASNLVANWITLSNYDSRDVRGELIFYGQDGSEIATQSISLQAGSRVDYPGHSVGPMKVGLVEWRPASDSVRVQLRNIRYLFDNPGMFDSFDTAFQLEGMYGSGEPLSVPLNTGNGSAILELSNVSTIEETITAEIYGSTGNRIWTDTFTLGAHQSRHIIADSMLGGAFGSAVIRGTRVSSVVAVAMEYVRGADGSIDYMYGIAAKQALGRIARGTYNTFLEQQSRLTIVNSSAQTQTASLSMVRSDGSAVSSDLTDQESGARLGEVISLPPFGSVIVNLNSFDSIDAYGVVTIESASAGAISSWITRTRRSDYAIPAAMR